MSRRPLIFTTIMTTEPPPKKKTAAAAPARVSARPGGGPEPVWRIVLRFLSCDAKRGGHVGGRQRRSGTDGNRHQGADGLAGSMAAQSEGLRPGNGDAALPLRRETSRLADWLSWWQDRARFHSQRPPGRRDSVADRAWKAARFRT